MKREIQLNVRLDHEENAAFEEAAQLTGMSTSAWVRQQLRLAAMQELSRFGKRAAFLKPVPLSTDGNTSPV
jgi:uncharacterized protein (DUF1778 family)